MAMSKVRIKAPNIVLDISDSLVSEGPPDLDESRSCFRTTSRKKSLDGAPRINGGSIVRTLTAHFSWACQPTVKPAWSYETSHRSGMHRTKLIHNNQANGSTMSQSSLQDVVIGQHDDHRAQGRTGKKIKLARCRAKSFPMGNREADTAFGSRQSSLKGRLRAMPDGRCPLYLTSRARSLSISRSISSDPGCPRQTIRPSRSIRNAVGTPETA